MASETAGAVTEGAAKGAAAGSVVPGYGTAIGAAIGAIGGFLSASGSRKASREVKSRSRRAQRMLRPSQILGVASKVQPKFRAMVAAGIGPGIEGRVAGNLARSGLTDTGAGEAIRNLSASLPGVIASQGALEFARQLQFARASAILGAPSAPPAMNPVLGAVAGGLTGGLTAYLQGRQPVDPNRRPINNDVIAIPSAPASVAPITPTAPKSSFPDLTWRERDYPDMPKIRW